jgi:hypothetical protein
MTMIFEKKHYFYRDYAQWKIKMFNRTIIIKLILEISDMEQKFKDYKAFQKAVLDSSLYSTKNRPQIYKTSSLH